MASGRVLIVHEAGASRAFVADLLAREGYTVEGVESTYRCIARFVEAPAALVLIGLAALETPDLDLIRTLKSEAKPPRILVTFPTSHRDLAVRALDAGADGYLLEPFYAVELVAAVRGQLGAAPDREPGRSPAAALQHLAREVAHAINNPLQVITLLLAKERVTKRELASGIPPQLARVESVVAHLKQLGALPEMNPEPLDPRPLVAKAADAAGLALREGASADALIDARHFPAALQALFEAVAVRNPDATVTLLADSDSVTLRCDAPADAESLLDALFVVDPTRDVLPGLLLPRLLLEAQGSSLTESEEQLFLRLPRAR